jgi:hypothetical protein
MITLVKKMRNEKFEKELISLEAKIHQKIQKIKGADLQQIVVSGLGSKGLSHCEMALSLVQSGALAEAIIILRAAYEAVIRGLYLNANPDQLTRYEAYSSITTHPW